MWTDSGTSQISHVACSPRNMSVPNLPAAVGVEEYDDFCDNYMELLNLKDTYRLLVEYYAFYEYE